MQDAIIVKGARENNLKNISLEIPKNKLVVLTGLSGSGKSTLALETLQRECMRQYMESMGMVTHALSRPKVSSITGLSPSISVGQHLSNRSPRSTVGTMTEVFTYLRLLFAKLGERPCPHCKNFVRPDEFEIDETLVAEWEETAEPSTNASCPNCGHALPALIMAHFSFNKPEGACPTCVGLGVVSAPNLRAILDEEKSILGGGVVVWEKSLSKFYANALTEASKYYGFSFDPKLPIKEYDAVQRDLLLYGVEAPEFCKHFPHHEPPKNAFSGRFLGVVTSLMKKYAEHSVDDKAKEKMERFLSQQVCPDCNGARLNPQSRAVTVAGVDIVSLGQLSFIELDQWLQGLDKLIPTGARQVLRPITDDLAGRVKRIIDVGLGYLSMERPATSLSGGEAQRLRLASLLGSGLTGVLYVLDEPTTGLHARDTERLLGVLRQLRDLGNTVLVIEHDLDVISAADYVIDIGPGAGKLGGNVVATGSPAKVAQNTTSLTGQYLSGLQSVAKSTVRRPGNGRVLTIEGARENNLKDVDVTLPLGTITSLTGVSGSGKSTLLFDILDRALRKHFYGSGDIPGKHRSISGYECIDGIITIDQTPIGRIPRSNPATYTDVFTSIRNLYAALPAARKQGLEPRHFSFNVPGGRCEKCQGAGVLEVNMHFLPPVEVPCPSCRGRRFGQEVLRVQYQDASISDVLKMTVEEAAELFTGVDAIHSRLSLLEQAGLGYLQLGQPATTLSGGEAQRIKLAKELGRRGRGHMLYLLDEPTVGLHPHDVGKLLTVLQRLVDAGNTVIVIEHNLDIIRSCDWIIDFGPEGGSAGGTIIASGTPEEIALCEASLTGVFLRRPAL